MKGLDKKLPDLRHSFERAASQRIGVHGNSAPADDAQALSVGGGFDGGARFAHGGAGKKGEAHGENFGELDSLFLRAGAEEGDGERGQQAGTVTAGAIGVNAAAMREAL